MQHNVWLLQDGTGNPCVIELPANVTNVFDHLRARMGRAADRFETALIIRKGIASCDRLGTKGELCFCLGIGLGHYAAETPCQAMARCIAQQ